MKPLYLILGLVILLVSSCDEDPKEIEDIKDIRPFGTTIEVPTEVSTIKEAINIAQIHDTILLQPNEYKEWDLIINKAVFITSTFSAGKDSDIIRQTIVNANQASRVFLIENISDTVRMNGFTIRGGYAMYKSPYPTSKDCNGGGICCLKSNLFLTNIILTNNSARQPNTLGQGGALFIDESYIKLENVKITNNYALGTGGGIYCNKSSMYINFLTTTDNNGYERALRETFSDSYINLRNSSFNDKKRGSIYGEIIFARCNGLMENVKSFNVITFSDSPISLINCILP